VKVYVYAADQLSKKQMNEERKRGEKSLLVGGGWQDAFRHHDPSSVVWQMADGRWQMAEGDMALGVKFVCSYTWSRGQHG
jgi:hypothetical protein